MLDYLYVIYLQDAVVLVFSYSEWDNVYSISWGYNNAMEGPKIHCDAVQFM